MVKVSVRVLPRELAVHSGPLAFLASLAADEAAGHCRDVLNEVLVLQCCESLLDNLWPLVYAIDGLIALEVD